MEEPESPYRAVDILQTSMTVAAIALALATLFEEEGPSLNDVFLIPVTLIVAGSIAVISSGFAVAALHEEMDLTKSDLVDVRRPQTTYRQSVIIATWALMVLGLGYFWILIDLGL